MRFTTRVAIQRGIEVRGTNGAVSYTYEDVTGLESIPAVIMPIIDEKRQERMTPDENRWNIVLAGHWPQITPSMWVVNADNVRYEVVRISTTKRKRVTTVMARLGSL